MTAFYKDLLQVVDLLAEGLFLMVDMCFQGDYNVVHSRKEE